MLWFVLVNANSSLGHEIACSRIDRARSDHCTVKLLKEVHFLVDQRGPKIVRAFRC